MSEKHSERRKWKRVKTVRSGVSSPSNNDLDVLFQNYYDVKLAEGRAKQTLEKYRLIYGNLCKYLDVHGIGRDIRNIDVGLVRKYISWLLKDYVQFEKHKFKPDYAKKRGLSPQTTNDYLKTLRTFFRFLVEEGKVDVNPFEAVNSVKYTDTEILVLTAEELKVLLEAPDKRTYTGFRDYVLMTLLIDTMTRINEALSLKTSDVDFSNNTITVRATIAKNRKARIIPIQKQTAKLLKELIKEIEEFECEYIFLANYGERLTSNHFRNMLRRHYIKKAGIKKRVHPHLFRHTAATMFLESGGDIRHLQLLLGHSDLRMVMRYTHLSNRALKEQHDRHSALNQLTGKLNQKRKTKR
ncbi:tyrosine-type recombinase/integrase [Mesobacillus maritimus]|uniref:Tyrosine-type recombinase/integrase n=1 Tax=Mesobacillus maritimus TaxID=1643336 RepID=A0ABS7K8S2_9BACI|nr:tyrosine-type recombinase/integrase [Mesobacillus maritimus]MBY0098664.1 tyrosine-type recombinase/integrase [Mesobacillus maritimus]